MSFLVSPGVHVKEIDLTNVVPSVDTTIGALAGVFEKGPISKVVNITSEADLLKNFGKPNASNFEWWFTCSNFLKYYSTSCSCRNRYVKCRRIFWCTNSKR